MNHAEVRSKMADYLEGDLDLTQRALLDAHLDGCGRCSGDFAEMRGTITALRSLPDPEPPPFLVETVMRRIREGEGRRTLADRLRDLAASVVSPPVAIPATALALGLLMATGAIDPGNLSLEALLQRAQGRAEPVREGFVRVERPAPRVTLTRGASPPPAVGRAPGIRITLPPPMASDSELFRELASVGAPRSGPGHWSPRSMRTNVASNPLTLPVSNGPVVPETGPRMGSAFETPGFSLRSGIGLESLLETMIERPVQFSAEFASRSIPEQEHWLRALASYAHDQGRDQEALASLRAATDLRARQVSTAFAAELRRIRNASAVAVERQGAEAR